jgi:hypothetical protein
MEKYAFNQWVADFCKNILESFPIVWKFLGVWGKVISIILSTIVAYFVEQVFSPTIFIRTFLYMLIAYAVIAVFYAIVIHPYKIIKEQKYTISFLRDKVNRENIILSLSAQRAMGVALRNRGEILLSESSIQGWWNEHLNWHNNTKQLIAILDESKSLQWNTLDKFQPKRGFPNAINQDHRHKLQMFDEWLDRLDKLINDFSS